MRRWESISLRTKITGVTVLILTFGILIVGTGTMMILRPQLEAGVDKSVQAFAIDPTPALRPGTNLNNLTRDDVINAPRNNYVAVLDGKGDLVYNNYFYAQEASVPLIAPGFTTEYVQNLGTQTFRLQQENSSVEWSAIFKPIATRDSSESQATLVIAKSLADIDETMVHYISIFSGFGITVVILGAVLTRILVTSAFEPLHQVEATADAIAAGDFNQRVPSSEENTEVGRLVRALNTMLRHIDSALNDRAKTINQMRRFVGDASHELRTPLVSVRGYAELYRMGAFQKPEDVTQAMDRIEKEAIRMGTLVEDLLALARLDETKPLEKLPVDLVPLAKDAALDAMAQQPAREVRVLVSDTVVGDAEPSSGNTLTRSAETEKSGTTQPSTGSIAFATATIARLRQMRMRKSSLADTQPLSKVPQNQTDNTASEHANPAAKTTPTQPVQAVIRGDENKIRQVMTNLIGNAIRFTDDNSPLEIVISVNQVEKTATFEIVDHGEGIPEQIREKIFQRFWRADTSRTRETGGSGLGLAIVSSIVAAHNGTVSAHETPGGGATFRVTLPLDTETVQQSGEKTPEKPQLKSTP
ncbi:HAMP domain-containing sensor histidine kinase [Lysinibacter sp. HNR]|uniref:sensor histidine kinase n=1 Tax=Lysinibacter sp. HNR TaxID=3031408 RepID=UPI002435E5EB|nr:HAMP domain-containing sensor histidine kinase [Lysinibacter sp. HNR]WGD36991.1 HAMP domain-containing sensor histidine kinase [Lysinibacter sp. HNR]